jgi:hypothetical protein
MTATQSDLADAIRRLLRDVEERRGRTFGPYCVSTVSKDIYTKCFQQLTSRWGGLKTRNSLETGFSRRVTGDLKTGQQSVAMALRPTQGRGVRFL